MGEACVLTDGQPTCDSHRWAAPTSVRRNSRHNYVVACLSGVAALGERCA